ncbi:MAG: nucleoside-diphosphate kinase, partial [Planctomycetes bacterium]|nr:nucleoside-diphosphate kinase [Planctomycetota bacterium]
RNATAEFNRVVRFLTGVEPDEMANHDNGQGAGRSHCLALLYQGPDAVEKVKSVLGGINPIRTAAGDYRSEFAQDLVRSGAHASANAEDALRERDVVGLADREADGSDFAGLIGEYLRRRNAHA